MFGTARYVVVAARRSSGPSAVITVCDDANETCPAFVGTVRHRVHLGFEDPAKASGSEAFILGEFRRIRDQIRIAFDGFIKKEIA